MGSRKSESGNAVVEGGGVPPFGGMAIRAIRHRERRAGGRVRGIIGLLPGRQVAAGISAIRRRNLEVVVVVDVAGRAGNIGVPICQQKSSRCVIEVRRVPAFGRMAVGAIRQSKCRACRGMRWIVRLLPGRQVAAGISAIRRRNLEVVVVVGVAGGTSNIGVPESQRKSRSVMIKLRAQPTVEGMARITSRCELRACVVRIRRFLKIR